MVSPSPRTAAASAEKWLPTTAPLVLAPGISCRMLEPWCDCNVKQVLDGFGMMSSLAELSRFGSSRLSSQICPAARGHRKKPSRSSKAGDTKQNPMRSVSPTETILRLSWSQFRLGLSKINDIGSHGYLRSLLSFN